MRDTLVTTDPGDLADALMSLQRSFGVTLEVEAVRNVATFGELCDYVSALVPGSERSDCTLQQAFYRLRAAFRQVEPTRSIPLAPGTLTSTLLPRAGRRALVRRLEGALQIDLGLLEPPAYVIVPLLLAVLASLPLMHFAGIAGGVCLTVSLVGLMVAYRFGTQITQPTLGHLARRMAGKYYRRSRRYPHTVNRTEIESLLTDLFVQELGIDAKDLSRETLWRYAPENTGQPGRWPGSG
ncbi:hypothetical protein [Lewinella sp. IMCC34183]|uniref:hypothetical protein n=1 Tax=Lewinella sp. IMCC34183 TaxID=2248762 RepID=UPI000E277DF4|nr:hypothetical protein [Lewinella sp. IMCC34183]